MHNQSSKKVFSDFSASVWTPELFHCLHYLSLVQVQCFEQRKTLSCHPDLKSSRYDMHTICIGYAQDMHMDVHQTLSNRVQIGVHVTGGFASHLLRANPRLEALESSHHHGNHHGIYKDHQISDDISTNLYGSELICYKSPGKYQHRHCEFQCKEMRWIAAGDARSFRGYNEVCTEKRLLVTSVRV